MRAAVAYQSWGSNPGFAWRVGLSSPFACSPPLTSPRFEPHAEQIDQWNFVLSPETGSQDPSGHYCRRWVPELAKLPAKHIHTPWKAPADVLAKAGVALGRDYPERIVVDLHAAREQTVGALLAMRAAALEHNDGRGYDLIRPPSGESTCVFTKQEFRLDAAGQRKEAPPRVSRGGGRGGGRGGDRGGRARKGGSKGAAVDLAAKQDRGSILAFFKPREV